MQMDLRNEIEHHCEQCSKRDTESCSLCFFGSVDFGKCNLGSRYAYQRAFRYLKVLRMRGFQRNDMFGSHLNISRRAVVPCG